jgi:ubiquinone/menaquinone biosynthesis C-methylase UbiE
MSDWTKKRSLKRRYDLTANIYDARYSEEQEVKYEATLAKLRPTGLVLDIGCGTGLLFNHISSEIESVVAVDVSKKLLQQAWKKAKQLRNVQIHVVQADADHLPFRDYGFNTVFAFTVLQNMPKPLGTLVEAYRVMRRDAFVVITGLKKVFSTENLSSLFGGAGFNVVSIKDYLKSKDYIIIARKNL